MTLRTSTLAPVIYLLTALYGLWVASPLPAQGRYLVAVEPEGTAVGLALMVNAGSVWELRSEAGLTYLTARSMIEGLRPKFEVLGGRARAECDAVGIRLILSLPAGNWKAGADLFLSEIFGGTVDARALEAARSAILAEAALTEESLSTEIQDALAEAAFGEGDRWARPGCGTAASIRALNVAEARRLAKTRFTPFHATAALVGAVDEAEGRALLSRHMTGADLPILIPAPSKTGDGRVYDLERNSITSWVGISFPFPRTAEAEAIRLLAFLLSREVAPTPARPEIYDATVEVVQHGGGGAIQVYLVLAPAHTRRWIDRVREVLRTQAGAELSDPVFDALRRRYSGARLLGLETPEARAEDLARQLFFEQGSAPAHQRIAVLTPASLQRAATLLGEPTIALLGPR